MAIDWSGRSGSDQRRFLWLAEAVDGELVRLEGGRTRAELVELLITEANRDPDLIVGVDFAFSLPAWYLQERQLTPRQLWALLADEALTPAMRQLGLTRWMNRPELPFWITGEAHARLAPEQMLRRTEQEVRVPGVQPKSVFQLVGAGQVGRGSLYGMAALHQLAGAGFRIATSGASERQGIVQRLDVGTSGVMVICKSEHAYSVLKDAFRHRTVDKTYHALVQGHPDPLEGTIDAPIGRHPKADYKFAVMADGRHSVTHYETLEAHRFASLLEVHLETGRTHQIRVHMAALKHPCVGDLTYGADPVLAKRFGLERQWLHAVRLGFEHPDTGKYVEYESEYPDDLAQALEVVREAH